MIPKRYLVTGSRSWDPAAANDSLRVERCSRRPPLHQVGADSCPRSLTRLVGRRAWPRSWSESRGRSKITNVRCSSMLRDRVLGKKAYEVKNAATMTAAVLWSLPPRGAEVLLRWLRSHHQWIEAEKRDENRGWQPAYRKGTAWMRWQAVVNMSLACLAPMGSFALVLYSNG